MDEQGQLKGVLLAFDEAFLRPGLVATSTALQHTKDDVRVFVGGAGLSQSAKDQLLSLSGSERLVIVDVDRLLSEISSVGRLPSTTWARVFVDVIVPETYSRVLYLDADTMTRRPLDDLFEADLHGHTLGACVDNRPTHAAQGSAYWIAAGSPPSAAYFNAGVMLIEMSRWRELEVRERALQTLRRGVVPLEFHDQDALNALLWDDWYPLSRAWNYSYFSSQIGADHAAVVHFVTPRRPWLGPVPIPTFQKEYLEEAEKVGWAIENSRVDLVRAFLRGIVPTGLTERRHRGLPLPRKGQLVASALAPSIDLE